MALIRTPPADQEAGFSLVEMMISMTIGLLILLAVISIMVTSSRSQKELEQSGHLVENAHYAVNVLYDDLRHAGYYGHYFVGDLTTPATLPDPCATDAASLEAALVVPVQGYHAATLAARPDLTGTTCAAALLTNDNLQPGSDILVVRRADTAVLTGTPVTNEVYLQGNVTEAAIQIGSPLANVPATTADGGAVTIMQRSNATTSAAQIRKLHVGVYFVAPCSEGSGANGVCTAVDDTIPTLKRLDLTVSGGLTAMVLTPVAEGVEIMRLLYGVDSDTTDVNNTGLIGDGVPDLYIEDPLTQWGAVMSVQLHLLVRAPVATPGHVDNKSFQVAGTAVPAFNDGFRRHVFASEVRLVNLAGPRSTQ